MGQNNQPENNTITHASYKEKIKAEKLSTYPPYRISQLHSLQRVFQSLQVQNKITLKTLDNILWLSQHPFYNGIVRLFGDQIKKINAKSIDFELFLTLMSVFHVDTDMNVKAQLVFMMLDVDRDGKISARDVAQALDNMPLMSIEERERMAKDALARMRKDYIDMQGILNMTTEGELEEVMTGRFDHYFM